MIQLFISHDQLQDKQLSLKSDDYHHLVRVLHVGKSEIIRLIVDEKEIVLVEISDIFKTHISISIEERKKIPPKNGPTLFCAQALLKQDKFSDILRSCTELGVDGFIPIETARSISFSSQAAILKQTRWKTILKQAAEQSQRYSIPVLESIQTWDAFIQYSKSKFFDLKLVLWEGEKTVSLKSILSTFRFQFVHKTPSILILTGPEGGFLDQEIGILQDHSFVSVSIGNSILRTEHAGFAACAMVLYEYL